MHADRAVIFAAKVWLLSAIRLGKLSVPTRHFSGISNRSVFSQSYFFVCSWVPKAINAATLVFKESGGRQACITKCQWNKTGDAWDTRELSVKEPALYL